MDTTTTIRYREDGSIQLLEMEVPAPGPGQIQLSGGACGICSWDIGTVRYGEKMVPKAPPGHEGMGTVVQVGPGITDFKPGDKVAGGGFAGLRNIPIERAYKLPESDLADEFWIVEPVSCAVTGLDHCRLKPGDRVAVIGSGFMGLLLIQGLLNAYVDDLVVMDINQDRLDLAQRLGVGEVYNVGTTDVAELAPALHARNFDVVVDTTGSQPGLDLAGEIVRRGGLINLFGWIKGERASFNPTKWHLGGFSVVNSSPGARLRDPFPPAINLIHKGVFDLRPLVTHLAPLQEYPTLMNEIVNGDPTYVKGVISL